MPIFILNFILNRRATFYLWVLSCWRPCRRNGFDECDPGSDGWSRRPQLERRGSGCRPWTTFAGARTTVSSPQGRALRCRGSRHHRGAVARKRPACRRRTRSIAPSTARRSRTAKYFEGPRGRDSTGRPDRAGGSWIPVSVAAPCAAKRSSRCSRSRPGGGKRGLVDGGGFDTHANHDPDHHLDVTLSRSPGPGKRSNSRP